MASENIKTTSDGSFETDVLKNSKPALVDYWATWCAPCRALAPVIDEIAAQYAGQVDVFKMDIDQNPATPAQLGIRGVPTVILFKDGKAVGQVVGAVPKAQIENLIKQAL